MHILETKKTIAILFAIGVTVIAITVFGDVLQQPLFSPTASDIPIGLQQVSADDITIVAQSLSIPWDVAFLPNGDILITERTGTLVRIAPDGTISRIPVTGITATGEGGLLGMALHPQFEENRYLYLYKTTTTAGNIRNSVVRYQYQPDTLANPTVIISDIPGGRFHDGGRIRFGPDGLLYITTGDAGNAQSAQNINTLSGKILRLHDNGRIPSDNPFGNALWSYGHRNPQGLAWDSTGQLWATEHGRSGALSGFDELNRIERAGNYGWPVIQGGEQHERMISPVAHSGSDDTWAPASAAYWDGSIVWGGLRGQALYEATLRGNDVVGIRRHVVGVFGRIRTVLVGPDGHLYITTSNTDGRGDARSGDDKLIRINPVLFRAVDNSP